MTLTVTDMFCGAGGSSLGASFNEGVELKLALNHWPRAIETHNTNFPNAGHDCADVSQVNPRRYGSTDILLASPECTNHSLAKGARRRKTPSAQGSIFEDGPASDAEQEKSRATMWDVPRFAEHHRYRAIVVENVVDAYKWGPDDDGSLFHSWLGVMTALGYEHEIVYLNSMFTGLVPQSRDRMYVVFWQRGIKRPDLRFEPPSWCVACEKVVAGRQHFKRTRWGRYGAQYVYRCPTCLGVAIPGALPAATAIDFSKPAERIGDRARPLANKTRERIKRGLERVASEPFAIRLLQGGTPRPTTLPLVTLTARHDMGIVMPVAGSTSETTPGNRARQIDLTPFPTVHGTNAQALVVPPMGSVAARDVAQPSPTQTTTTRPAMVIANRANAVGKDADQAPAQTVATGGHLGLVTPAGGTWRDNATSTEQPMPTRTGSESDGLVVSNYAPGWTREARAEPIGTVTTKDGHALLVPYVSGNVPAIADREPSGTLTTRDRVGLAWGDTEIDNCRFRMFDLDEIARTMAMHEHVDGSEYVVTGNKRERMAQYGNGVTPPVMQAIVARLQAVLA